MRKTRPLVVTMTPKQTKIIGLRYSFFSALYIFVLYEIILLITETSGDFANGILFFFDLQMNFYSATVYATIFLSFSLLGSNAGYRIIIKKASPIKLSIFYSLVTTILVFIMPAVQMITIWNLEGINDQERKHTIQSFFQFLLVAFLCFLGGWLLSAYRINKRKTS